MRTRGLRLLEWGAVMAPCKWTDGTSKADYPLSAMAEILIVGFD